MLFSHSPGDQLDGTLCDKCETAEVEMLPYYLYYLHADHCSLRRLRRLRREQYNADGAKEAGWKRHDAARDVSADVSVAKGD